MIFTGFARFLRRGKHANLNYGLTVSAIIIGVTIARHTANAVLRNHTKRLLREAYPIGSRGGGGFDLIFMGKPQGQVGYNDVLQDMRYLL